MRCRYLTPLIGLVVMMSACGADSPTVTPKPTTTVFSEQDIIPTMPQRPGWTPKRPIAPVVMSEDDMMKRRRESLDGLAKYHSLRPWQYPELVRWILPEQVASVMIPCLKQRGFVVKGNSSGRGYEVEIGAQGEAFGKAEIECTAMFTVDPRLEGEPTLAQKNLTYDYWIEYLVPCLKRHGIHPEVPSREVFLSKPVPMQEYPHDDEVIVKECPYGPPSNALLGET